MQFVPMNSANTPIRSLLCACLVVVVILIVGCDGEADNAYPEQPKTFAWPSDIAKLTGKNLRTWIRTAPFQEIFDPYKGVDSDHLVFTNTETIFPYLGAYYAVDGSDSDYATDHARVNAYASSTVYYQDKHWGPAAVHAALFYYDSPIWLDDFYVISRAYSRMTGSLSTGAPSTPAYMRLKQTHIAGIHEQYRTAVYIAYNPLATRSLLGFYQKGPLVFEVAFRCPFRRNKACLKQLVHVADRMGLSIPEWTQATANELETETTGDTFWDAQFKTIHPASPTMSVEISARIVGTAFELRATPTDTAADFTLTKTTPHGHAVVAFNITTTDLTEEEFTQQARGAKYRFGLKPIFITPAKPSKSGPMTGEARVYLNNEPRQKLEIVYTYPKQDQAARDQLRALISSLQFDEN